MLYIPYPLRHAYLHKINLATLMLIILGVMMVLEATCTEGLKSSHKYMFWSFWSCWFWGIYCDKIGCRCTCTLRKFINAELCVMVDHYFLCRNSFRGTCIETFHRSQYCLTMHTFADDLSNTCVSGNSFYLSHHRWVKFVSMHFKRTELA